MSYASERRRERRLERRRIDGCPEANPHNMNAGPPPSPPPPLASPRLYCSYRLKTSAALWPPKPRLSEMTTLSGVSATYLTFGT